MKINNKKVNLLIVESGGGHGGSASYLLSFLKHLNKDVFIPTVVLYRYSNTEKVRKIIEELKVKVIFLDRQVKKKVDRKVTGQLFQRIRLLKYLFLLWPLLLSEIPRIIKLICIIKKNKVDVVLINSEVIFNVSAVFAAKISHRPCIVRKSGGVSTESGKKIRKILSYFVDAFIASSNAELNAHIENKLPYQRLLTVYEGVDLDYFCPSKSNNKIRVELNITTGQYIVGNISRIDYGKGHQDFINAAAIVLKDNPNTFFLIVGDDFESKGKELKKSLHELGKSLGMGKNLIFLGWREDILDILQCIDIFVHCPDTWKEGMGIATLEAIACGKPTVITDNWGLAETTKDCFNGFVVPIGNKLALAEKIEMLIKNSSLRQEMERNARVYAESNFNIKKNISRIEEVILETFNNEN